MSEISQPEKAIRTQQADATRQRLVDVGRQMFGRKPYSTVSAQEIADKAGVTRGALYHHFKTGKSGLFEAVAEGVLQDLVKTLVEASAKARAGWPGIRDMLETYFDAALTDEHTQIALQDAPSVLGSERWRQLEYAYSVRFLRQSLEQLIEEGTLREVPVDPLATLIFGALCESTLAISEAADTARAKEDVLETFELMLSGIRVQSQT